MSVAGGRREDSSGIECATFPASRLGFFRKAERGVKPYAKRASGLPDALAQKIWRIINWPAGFRR